MLEVYNESLRDLLSSSSNGSPEAASKPLDVSAMGAGQLAAGAERVPGLTWRAVSGVEEVLAVLEGVCHRTECDVRQQLGCRPLPLHIACVMRAWVHEGMCKVHCGRQHDAALG
jgi:hypothetical protein